jgi:hypothetical protein
MDRRLGGHDRAAREPFGAAAAHPGHRVEQRREAGDDVVVGVGEGSVDVEAQRGCGSGRASWGAQGSRDEDPSI